jgi:glycosyltransferase involved in cell wall biosynthesis
MTLAPPSVSVVIPTRNRAAHLREAIESLRAGALQDFEVFIMDQSDGDEAERVAASFQDARLRYCRMPRPGACPARNLGAALAGAPIIAFLDDDCCPRHDWLRRIVDAFAADASLQFIFGALSAPEGEPREGTYPVFTPSAAIMRPSRRRRIVTAAAGANMSCRKDFLRRHGGFDELLGPAAPGVMSNDTSICFKVLRSGEKWLASPEIDVIHKNGFRTYEQWGRLLRGYAHGSGVNYGRFARRGALVAAWHFLLETPGMLASPLGAALRLRRPHGLGLFLLYVRGFLEGVRLPGRVGYVDGAAMRRMEEVGRLIEPAT